MPQDVNVMQFILAGKGCNLLGEGDRPTHRERENGFFLGTHRCLAKTDLAPRELLWQMWNCRINGDVMKA
ncbi:unnamed protein product [Caretta caretta]